MLARKNFEPYQHYLVRKIISLVTSLITVDMSMGKTVCALTAAAGLINQQVVQKVLVVAPKLVAQKTWPEEVKKWKQTRYLKIADMTGNPKKREQALKSDADIYIINRENLVWLYEQIKDDPMFQMLIYDESSRLKAGNKRSKRRVDKNGVKQKTRLSEFGALCRIRKNIKYVTLLTGTPTPNGLIDLWAQAYVLDYGERLGSTKKAFLDRWFKSDYMGWKWEPRPNAFRQIMRQLEDVMISLREEDHREAIGMKYLTRTVELPAPVMKEYKRFRNTLVSELYDVEAVSKGVLTNKLLQFANGSMFRNDPDKLKEREVVKIHTKKIELLEEMMEHFHGEQVIIAYNFNFDKEAILKKFPKAVCVDTHKNWKELWDSKKAGILLAHPAQIGHGLNLQKGGRILVWYGLTWSLELYQQLNKRLPRPGQEYKRVLIYHIVAKGTVDENVLDVLQSKEATQDAVTAAVRKVIKGE